VDGAFNEGGLFGYIVELRPGVRGLIRSGDPRRDLSVGDVVEFVIVEVEWESKKIRLMPSPQPRS
jgi:ribosomal protein S1